MIDETSMDRPDLKLVSTDQTYEHFEWLGAWGCTESELQSAALAATVPGKGSEKERNARRV